MITLQDILAVDGGRGYIEMRYHDAIRSFSDTRRKFKMREEKTASASVYQKDGIWYVTDFGEDSKRRNAVDVCMHEDGVEFAEACRRVATFYGLRDSGSASAQASFDKWAAKPDEQEGAVIVQHKEFGMAELRTLFSQYAWEAMGKNDADRTKVAIGKCTYLHYKCVDWYTYTKDGVTMKYTSNKDFPIFVIDEGDWQKIYKPKDKKEYRFFSKGQKPADFVHGLSQLEKFVAQQRAEDAKSETFDEESEDMKEKKRVNDFKANEVIICTGGSDALNISALGYHVIWFNSETAGLLGKHHTILNKLAWHIYNLPDIDVTGKKEAHKLAMEYLDVKTIRLPEYLKERKDLRGNECKDVRDFLNFYNRYDFKKLVETALPYQFWEEEQRVKNGKPVKKFGKYVWDYNFNNTRVYNFLFQNGFARFVSEKEKEGFFFVKIDEHVVRQVETHQIRTFIYDFLEQRFANEDLRNVVYRSPQLGDSSLANMPLIQLDFEPYDVDSQYLFFQTYNALRKRYEGKVWRVTAKGVEVLKTADKYVWQDKVIEKKINVLPNVFECFKDHENDVWDVKIGENLPLVMKFLIQTCRTHWRAELEERLGICSRLKTKSERQEYAEKHNLTVAEYDRIFDKRNTEGSDFVAKYRETFKFSLTGYLLTETEQSEQKQHFVNRVFTLGYLQHRYKNPSKPWGVWIMDNKLSEEGESHGGSGKSLLTELLIHMQLKVEALSGRHPKLTENPHVFENIDLQTDLVNTDDCFDYFDIGFFYTSLTSNMSVNPKNKKSFTIPFSKSPKFVFSSNFGDRNTNPSDQRRKLYTVYSDYYHENTGTYNETRKPDVELGGNLFLDFSEKDWEEYYNFMVQCIGFYLSTQERVQPPLGNVMKRNLIAEMSEGFKVWADVYFDLDSGRVNDWYRKDFAFEDYKKESGVKSITSTAWKKRLVAWCKFMKYELNPEGIGSSTRKVKYTDNGGHERETSKEHIFIKIPEKRIDDEPDF